MSRGSKARRRRMARERLAASQLGQDWEHVDPEALAVERATERLAPDPILSSSDHLDCDCMSCRPWTT